MMNQNQRISDPKDVELEATIHRAIRHMGVGIHVTVRGGHVSLSGLVDDFYTKRDVASVVRSVAGVHEVTNALRIAPVND
jgi:osmotically-inducible protein OsmY